MLFVRRFLWRVFLSLDFDALFLNVSDDARQSKPVFLVLLHTDVLEELRIFASCTFEGCEIRFVPAHHRSYLFQEDGPIPVLRRSIILVVYGEIHHLLLVHLHLYVCVVPIIFVYAVHKLAKNKNLEPAFFEHLHQLTQLFFKVV